MTDPVIEMIWLVAMNIVAWGPLAVMFLMLGG